MAVQQTRIRTAKDQDLPEMIELLAELFAVESDFQIDPGRQEKGLKLLLESDQAIVLVADTAGQVTGMCTGQVLISTAEGGPVLLVEDVVVNGEFQGKGIGRMLLTAIVDQARSHGISRLQLLADRCNSTALDFYAKNGWNSTQLICLRHYKIKP